VSEKVVRDGKVAVLYSPGYGAGWFSWNTGHEGLLYDPEIVAAVEADDRAEAAAIAERKYPDCYAGGASDLAIRWVDEGQRFRIDEYDGSESVVLCDEDAWRTA